MSKQYNQAGTSLVIDEVIEVAGKKKTFDTSMRIFDGKLIRRDISNLISWIDEAEDDGIITVAEKQTLQREYQRILSVHGVVHAEAVEYLLTEQLVYTNYETAYNDLRILLEALLDDPSSSSTLDPGVDLSDMFQTYYDNLEALENEIFLYTTGILNGLDDRLKLTLTIHSPLGRIVPPTGAAVTLSVTLLEEGLDITADYTDADFTWERETADSAGDTAWNAGDHTGKTLDITNSDLYNKSATFICTFYHDNGDGTHREKRGFITVTEEITGTPGEGAFTTDGNTITLDGYDDDGYYGSGILFFTVKNTRYSASAVSYTVDSGITGLGYILLDLSGGGSVGSLHFARLQPESDGEDASMTWVDYNDNVTEYGIDADWFVVGTFSFDGSSFEHEVFIIPQKPSSVVKNRFMDILGEVEDVSDPQLNLWAKAMGVDKVFGGIAVLEAFINRLIVNNFKITAADFELRAGTFEVGGVEQKVIDVVAGGITIFKIDPISKDIFIGNYDGGNGAAWDHSEGRFKIAGDITANSGTWLANIANDQIETVQEADILVAESDLGEDVFDAYKPVNSILSEDGLSKYLIGNLKSAGSFTFLGEPVFTDYSTPSWVSGTTHRVDANHYFAFLELGGSYGIMNDSDTSWNLVRKDLYDFGDSFVQSRMAVYRRYEYYIGYTIDIAGVFWLVDGHNAGGIYCHRHPMSQHWNDVDTCRYPGMYNMALAVGDNGALLIFHTYIRYDGDMDVEGDHYNRRTLGTEDWQYVASIRPSEPYFSLGLYNHKFIIMGTNGKIAVQTDYATVDNDNDSYTHYEPVFTEMTVGSADWCAAAHSDQLGMTLMLAEDGSMAYSYDYGATWTVSSITFPYDISYVSRSRLRTTQNGRFYCASGPNVYYSDNGFDWLIAHTTSDSRTEDQFAIVNAYDGDYDPTITTSEDAESIQKRFEESEVTESVNTLERYIDSTTGSLVFKFDSGSRKKAFIRDDDKPCNYGIDVTYPAKLVLLQDMIFASGKTIEFMDSGDEPW